VRSLGAANSKLTSISASTELARLDLSLNVGQAMIDALAHDFSHQWM
jgi:hypothetical protein